MAYHTSMVKDLSIALEAVSRINCEGSPELYSSIEYALTIAISKCKKELTTKDKDETSTDDIPF